MRQIPAIILLLLLGNSASFSQAPGGRAAGSRGGQSMTGRMYGKIVDSLSNKPVEFATVELIQSRFDSVAKKRKDITVSGMLTKANGEFSLENVPVMGQYKLRVSIIGFKPLERSVSFGLNRNNGGDMSAMIGALDKDLGNIKIFIENKVLDNVTVTSSKPLFQMGIDKKVFNVDKNIVSAGGSAVDVMRSVPSLNVDLDGNVTLRNNTPQVFVDGRPTTMTLEQIPADAIESVEIITNPSAKYDASGGTAGILNVVLKKNRKVGYNGNVRVNVDSRGRVGSGVDFNVRQNKINVFAGLNFNQRKSISNGKTERTTLITNPNTLLHQNDKTIFKGGFGFARGGIDYFIDNRNTLSITGNFGKGIMKPNSESDIYTDSLYPGNTTYSFSERNSNSRNEFRNAGTQLSFKHNFPRTGQEFTADVTYNAGRNLNSNLLTTNYYTLPANNLSGTYTQRQDGKGTNKNMVIQSDYTNPLSEKSKIEIGARASIRTVNSENNFFSLDPVSGDFIYNPALSIRYNSKDQVYAAYTTFTNQLKNFGYQLGLRVESSNYEGDLPDTKETFKINFPVSFFPSVFLSQKMKGDNELQLNYTRRINRPNFWQLFPYTDFSDSLNLSRGNPNLQPEFTNSFELSYQKIFKNKDNFIASVYFKNTNNLITRFQDSDTSLYGGGKPVFVSTFINANSSYVTGLELISKNKITKWWDMTSNLNLYTSKIDIEAPNQPDQDQFPSWFAKINNTFKLPKNFTLQISGDYQSKTILPPGGSGGGSFGGGGGGRGGGGGGGGFFGQPSASQGYIRPNYGVDAAVRFEFLKNKTASLSLNVNDIFRTRRQDVHSESAGFIQDSFRRRDPQVFRLNFNWRFGKFDASLFKRKNTKSDNLQNDGGGVNF